MRVGGFSIHAKAKARRNYVFTARVSIDSNTLWVNGDYNVSTGKVTNFVPDPSFDVDVDVDMISILSLFLPGIDLALSQGFESSLTDSISSSLNDLSATEYTTFGLDQHIPSGVFIYNGVDYGAKAKNSFLNFIDSGNITITVEETIVKYKNESYFYIDYAENAVSISISDKFFLKFDELATFQWINYDCNPICIFIP